MHYTRGMNRHSSHQTLIKPAPWVLKGSGIILTTSFDATEVTENPLTELWLRRRCLGGRGFYLALSYESSAVGPYSEFSVLPGRFQAPQGKRYAIAQSFCDSKDAIYNYSSNWGIDTKPANIAQNISKHGEATFSLRLDESEVFSTKVKPYGPSLPFASGGNLIKLISEQGKKRFYLGFSIKGKVRMANLLDFNLDDSEIISPLQNSKVRAFYLEEFSMELPIPIKETTIEHFKFRLAQQPSGTASS